MIDFDDIWQNYSKLSLEYNTVCMLLFSYRSFKPDTENRPRWGQCELVPYAIRALKLFSKYSNLCDHGTWTLQTDRQTDGQRDRRLTLAWPRSA